MKIKLTTIHVDNQDKALRFYTEVLGFVKKADFSRGPFRWLTVATSDEPDGVELQLALADDVAKAYQQARHAQKQPALMLYSDDVTADHARISERGGTFAMPPTEVPGATITTIDDTCGNVVQISQLARR